MPQDLADQILKVKNLEIHLEHRGVDGKEFQIAWEEQSSGTQKFFALSGPWLDILTNGYIAELDEIESSMHPSMVTALLRYSARSTILTELNLAILRFREIPIWNRCNKNQ